MKPIVIAESATEPITLAEAAANLRADEDDNSPPGYVEQDRILALIRAARVLCEEEIETSLVEKTLEVAVDSFHPRSIELPYGPVRSVVSVTYVDSNGADALLAADQYRINWYAVPQSLVPVYGVCWPAARCDLGSVRVRYMAGYPSADSPPQVVPEPIKQAMHLYVAHYFANREAVDADRLAELPLGARHLLSAYRRGLGV